MGEDSGIARVLVVDDDEASREATMMMLEMAGYETRGEQNGALGLEAVITYRPEVVVFDFWMPVADGRELVQGIREVSRIRIGLVAMSGTPEVEDWCGRVGVARFVRKPFDKATLLSAVSTALDEARTSSTRQRMPSGSPTSRRLKIERSVLVVGEAAMVGAVRTMLRDAARPMQVATVEGIGEAVRALASISVDVVAVCGIGDDTSALVDLLATSSARGVPMVIEPGVAAETLRHRGVHVSRASGPEAVVESIHEIVSLPRIAATS